MTHCAKHTSYRLWCRDCRAARAKPSPAVPPRGRPARTHDPAAAPTAAHLLITQNDGGFYDNGSAPSTPVECTPPPTAPSYSPPTDYCPPSYSSGGGGGGYSGGDYSGGGGGSFSSGDTGGGGGGGI